MADFQSNDDLQDLGVRVIVASVDSAEQSATLAEELGLANLEMASGLDAISVAASVGGYLDTSDDPFLQPTAFVLDPENRVVISVYSSGAFGRLPAGDVVKVVNS